MPPLTAGIQSREDARRVRPRCRGQVFRSEARKNPRGCAGFQALHKPLAIGMADGLFFNGTLAICSVGPGDEIKDKQLIYLDYFFKGKLFFRAY